MADNNKKEYTTGGSSSFDLFDSFDSMPVRKPEPKPVQKEEAPVSEVKTEIKAEEKTQNEKKSPLFAILCVIMCTAIIACACLSFGNLSKPKGGSDTDADVNSLGNIYSDMVAKYPATKYPSNIQQSLVKAYSANNDVVGWLYIPGTAVNTPIVQNADNTYYLRHNFFGSNTNYGTAYADSRCKKETLSSNTVIYGHNMPSGTHFYDVSRYEDIEWYKQHPVIKYTTLTGEYTYLIYTAFYTTAQTKYNGNYFFNYILPNMGPKSLAGYIEQIDNRAIYKTGVDANAGDKFITLSTCTHSLDAACGVDVDARLVVVGRLLRGGENEDVDTTKAKSRPDYQRPQIWYDHNGKKNPYPFVKWIPSAE